MPQMKRCTKCGVDKTLDEFYKEKRIKNGLRSECKECNKEKMKKYREVHKKEIKESDRKYREKHGGQSMYNNKDCSQFLGIVVGERLCRHIFKDVEVMPNGNPNFDIICNKGKLIDVKSACIILDHGKYPHWTFIIKKNKIADYFICIALDNRTDLNPLHMWMIPGDVVNDKASITISPSTIHKWDEWKRDIDDVQLCCNTMKKGCD